MCYYGKGYFHFPFSTPNRSSISKKHNRLNPTSRLPFETDAKPKNLENCWALDVMKCFWCLNKVFLLVSLFRHAIKTRQIVNFILFHFCSFVQFFGCYVDKLGIKKSNFFYMVLCNMPCENLDKFLGNWTRFFLL